jgi:cytochrome bd-type quinol oxidase subunit 1
MKVYIILFPSLHLTRKQEGKSQEMKKGMKVLVLIMLLMLVGSMFMGNFSVQKDLTFEREVIAP